MKRYIKYYKVDDDKLQMRLLPSLIHLDDEILRLRKRETTPFLASKCLEFTEASLRDTDIVSHGACDKVSQQARMRLVPIAPSASRAPRWKKKCSKPVERLEFQLTLSQRLQDTGQKTALCLRSSAYAPLAAVDPPLTAGSCHRAPAAPHVALAPRCGLDPSPRCDPRPARRPAAGHAPRSRLF